MIISKRTIYLLISMLLFITVIGFWYLPSKSELALQAISDAGGSVSESKGRTLGFPYKESYWIVFDKEFEDSDIQELMPHFQNLMSIIRISFRQTQITDEGLSALARLDNLAAVDVSHSSVTPEGIKQLIEKKPINVIDNSSNHAVYPPEFLANSKRSVNLPYMNFQAVEYLCFSPSGNELAVVCRDTMHIWNTVTDKLVSSLDGGSFATFSENGSRIAVVDPGKGTFVYAVGDDSIGFFIPSELQSQNRAAFSSNGEFIYIWEHWERCKYSLSHETAVKVRDDGSEHEYPAQRSPKGTWGKINSRSNIRFEVTSENGDRVAWCEDPATNGLAKPEIYIVDCSDGRVLSTISTNGELVLFGGFDQRARRLVTSGTSGIHVYDVMTGQVVFEWDDPAGASPQVAISRNGKKVAAAYNAGSIKWWSIPE